MAPKGGAECTFAPVPNDRLAVNLESPVPASLPVGGALAVFCSGTASDGSSPVSDLQLLVDGAPAQLTATKMPRFDMPSRRSGFWGVVPVLAGASAAVELSAVLRGRDGTQEQRRLCRIPVVDSPPPHPVDLAAEEGGGDRGEPSHAADLIAVCMATFDPDQELLAAQLDSLRGQTDTAWVCVISDDHSSEEHFAELLSIVGHDPRFFVSRAPDRIGFYRNFERALEMAPPQAELIALCDQDDVWHPEKLSVLRSSIGSNSLVYSDSRLVARDGRVLRGTLWQGRSNNWTNLASLLFANTVTGAAALFRKEVAELALPFPDSPGIEFHDHWVALVALASGEIAYVDTPLYDYVQHSGAILGKVARVGGGPKQPRSAGRAVRQLPRMRALRAAYFLGWIPSEVRARTLLLRCANRLTPSKRRVLERHLRAAAGGMGFTWLVLRPLRGLWGRNETLGAEWELAAGILWRALAGLVSRIPGWPDKWLLDARFPDPPHFEHRGLRRWRSRVYDQRL
jgi:glycosyltransferase involved in cell wall biosynthesis